jgi:hypothetical protein
LRHLAEISASTALAGVSVHCRGKTSGNIHESRLVGHLKPEAPQVFCERGTTCSERDLGQQPEGVKEGRVARGILEARLGCICRQASHGGNVSAEAQLVDDLLPLPGFRQDAQSDVAHVTASTLKVSPRRL